MADNYLEKRQEELASGRVVVKRNTPSLDSLLLKNRSCRGFDVSYKVHIRQLRSIAAVNPRLASGRNAQVLRFKLVDADGGGAGLCRYLHLGAGLPELDLPLKGTEPQAFIVVCSTCGENPIVDIDLGISLQSMALKAVDMGLSALIVRSFDRKELCSALHLELEPLAVLCIGKGIERIELVAVDGVGTGYYRIDGVHYVPKYSLDELLL